MKAYEFQTKINKGIVQIPNNYLRELEKCQNVRGKPSESLTPVEDNQIISEQLKEDEVKEEENTTPHSPCYYC